jgi:hypothetical protein
VGTVTSPKEGERARNIEVDRKHNTWDEDRKEQKLGNKIKGKKGKNNK